MGSQPHSRRTAASAILRSGARTGRRGGGGGGAQRRDACLEGAGPAAQGSSGLTRQRRHGRSGPHSLHPLGGDVGLPPVAQRVYVHVHLVGAAQLGELGVHVPAEARDDVLGVLLSHKANADLGHRRGGDDGEARGAKPACTCARAFSERDGTKRSAGAATTHCRRAALMRCPSSEQPSTPGAVAARSLRRSSARLQHRSGSASVEPSQGEGGGARAPVAGALLAARQRRRRRAKALRGHGPRRRPHVHHRQRGLAPARLEQAARARRRRQRRHAQRRLRAARTHTRTRRAVTSPSIRSPLWPVLIVDAGASTRAGRARQLSMSMAIQG